MGVVTDPAATSVVWVPEPGMPSLADHWAALATSALLGHDRRPAPPPPYGPVADLVAARVGRDPAEAVVDQMAVLSVMRSAGVRPNPAVPTLVPCPPDSRPECPLVAVARLEEVLAAWPHLIDEWLQRVGSGGWSLPPEVAVALLARFRADPARGAVVSGLAGPLAEWLASLFPAELAPRPGRGGTAQPVALAVDPPLADEFADLVALPPVQCAAVLATGLAGARFANRHRGVLVRVVSSLTLDQLDPVAEALGRAASHPDTMGLALTLADLARFRLDLIRELLP